MQWRMVALKVCTGSCSLPRPRYLCLLHSHVCAFMIPWHRIAVLAMHPVFRFLRCVVNTAFRWLMLLLLLYLGSVLGQTQIPNIFWCWCFGWRNSWGFNTWVSRSLSCRVIHLIWEVCCLRFRDCTRYMPEIKKVLRRRRGCTSQYQCRGRRRA